MTMEEIINKLTAKDTKERLLGVGRIQMFLDQSQKNLSANEVLNLVDASMPLLRDNNYKVCQGILHVLTSVTTMSKEHIKFHFNQLVPPIVERLGDNKQSVRDASRRLLLALMEVSTPSSIAERVGCYAWGHKNWRVREEFAHTIASAFNIFATSNTTMQHQLLPPVVQLLDDYNSNVREAAMVCLEEMYRHCGQQVKEDLRRCPLRPAQFKDIGARFDRIDPIKHTRNEIFAMSASKNNIQPNSHHTSSTQLASANGHASHSQQIGSELKTPHIIGSHRRTSPQRRCSPKSRPIILAEMFSGGDYEGSEKPIDPIYVYSEKELTRELEKVAHLLKAEHEWSIRMAAMQKLEGLVLGGAAEYSCFLALLRQLVGPLCIQLSDRRSSIVKQGCQLLNILSRELRSGFDIFAEVFIPFLFKSVVITVLVIAESADNCIKTIIQNCCVNRVLPRIIECAKQDRNAVLRARCCEYALLVLERWNESLELHRAPELYEDLIRCCCGDAMGEVRSIARKCYRVFAKYWPDRARRVFSALDSTIQKLIYEEDGGAHKQYTSPTIQDRGYNQQQHLCQSTGIHALANHTIPRGVTHERSKSLVYGPISIDVTSLPQRESLGMPPERNLHQMLQASQHQVKAMERMLEEVDTNESGVLSETCLVDGSYRKIHDAIGGNAHPHIDPPSARDPPHPATAPASSHDGGKPFVAIVKSIPTRSNGTGRATTSQPYVDFDVGKERLNMATCQEDENVVCNNKIVCIGCPTNRPQGFKEEILITDKSGKKTLTKESGMDNGAKKKPNSQFEKMKVLDISSKGVNDSLRPNVRHHDSGRSSNSGSSLEDNHLTNTLSSYHDILSYMDGLMSLNDALTEGLGPTADWSSRVVAFTYLLKLLQQGPKGYQEVAQNFEQVMKLLSRHLDDPHLKVAQASLSALVELVPPCRRLFEPYLERILPPVFARLVDTKCVIQKLGYLALETIGNTYNIDSLLLPLLRSLDEQRTPKAKIAVIEFANSAFAKLAIDGCKACPNGLLKLWLGKLAPLANDKNPRLKEIAILGIISIYSNFESLVVLNFILGLPIEEQSILRKSLKQSTPHIDLDLMTYLQNKCQRPRIKCTIDHEDGHSLVGTDGETIGRVLSSLSSNSIVGRGCSAIPTLANGSCKWANNKHKIKPILQGSEQQLPHANDYNRDVTSLDMERTRCVGEPSSYDKEKMMCNGVCGSPKKSTHWLEQGEINLQSMSDDIHNIQSMNRIALEQQGVHITNMEAKGSNDALEDVPKTYAEIHLHQEKEYEFPTPQQTSLHALDVSNQVDTLESLKRPKEVASRQMTKKNLLAALKQSPLNINGCQRISYSSLHSRLPTK